MSQKHLIGMKCKPCKRINYYTVKNKKQVERKLDYKKFCKWCKKSTQHKECKV